MGSQKAIHTKKSSKVYGSKFIAHFLPDLKSSSLRHHYGILQPLVSIMVAKILSIITTVLSYLSGPDSSKPASLSLSYDLSIARVIIHWCVYFPISTLYEYTWYIHILFLVNSPSLHINPLHSFKSSFGEHFI